VKVCTATRCMPSANPQRTHIAIRPQSRRPARRCAQIARARGSEIALHNAICSRCTWRYEPPIYTSVRIHPLLSNDSRLLLTWHPRTAEHRYTCMHFPPREEE
jgi:hypothetical protein